MQQYLSNLTTGIKTRANATQTELEEQARIIEEEYALIKAAYDRGESGITRDMVDAAKVRMENARTEAGSVGASATREKNAVVTNAQTANRSATSNSAQAKNNVTSNYSQAATNVASSSATAKSNVTSNYSGAAANASSSSASVKSTVTSNYSGAASGAATGAAGVASATSTYMGQAYSTASTNANNIRRLFPINLGQLFTGTLTTIAARIKDAAGEKSVSYTTGVQRFAKAYENPYIFTAPTILTGDRGAYKGGEMMYGKDNLMRDIQEAANPITPAELYEIILAAVDKADLRVQISGREFGRIVRGVS